MYQPMFSKIEDLNNFTYSILLVMSQIKLCDLI